MTVRAKIEPLIMSGGAGARLWPKSRAARPEQVPPLEGRPLFPETAARRPGGDLAASKREDHL